MLLEYGAIELLITAMSYGLLVGFFLFVIKYLFSN